MDRRRFLRTATAAGMGLTFGAAPAKPQGKEGKGTMAFLTERTRNDMLFPRPAEGSTLPISPPGLAWLPCPGAAGYRVEIHRKGGGLAYGKAIGSDPVHLPDRALDPGDYTWDVIALDENGGAAARRGLRRFSIAPGAALLPWVDPAELLARVPPEHPRLLYPKAELPALRATLGTTRKRSWEACRRAADRALDRPAPAYPTYHRIEDQTRSRLEYGRYFAEFRRLVDAALIDLSLAFLMSQEQKYAQAAKRILLEVAAWPTDDEDVTSVSARWGDEPGLSLARCAHRAYDWLYPALSDEERARVLRMCAARAEQTYRRLQRKNYLTTPGESHDGRLIAYLADMALVMAGESDQAATWLNYSLQALTTFYPHWGGEDGGWAEGTAYGLWYNTFYLPAFEGLRQLTGFDLWKRPYFRNARHYFFYCTALRGEMRPFGDSALEGGPGQPGGGGYAELMAFHAHRFHDPHVGWWVQQIEGRAVGRGETALLFPDEPPARLPGDLPGARAFPSVGWAGLHSDVSRPDQDTCLIFKSSPYGSVSHSHADQNAFALMKGGAALAIPSGHYGPSYGMPHHALWTRSTKANNCVLVNGEGQAVRDSKATGSLLGFEERRGLSYVAGDAAPAYRGRLERCDRHILFLRPGLFLILDDLKAPQPARFQWMLHALEQMRLSGLQIVSERRGARLDVHLRSPAGLALHQTDQFDTPFNEGIPPEYHRDMPLHWHVTAETRDSISEVRIAAVLAVTGPGEKIEVQLLEREGWFGARATGDFGAVEGWAQIRPGAAGPDGFGETVTQGQAGLCGRAADSDVFLLEHRAP